MVKIQTYNNNGRVTGLQEYKNGQKVKLTYFYHDTAEYTPEDIKELESQGFTHDEAINAFTGYIETRYYFKDNKVLRGEGIYQNGEIVDIPREDC